MTTEEGWQSPTLKRDVPGGNGEGYSTTDNFKHTTMEREVPPSPQGP